MSEDAGGSSTSGSPQFSQLQVTSKSRTSSFKKQFELPITTAVLRLVWPSILLQSAHDRVATAAETVTASWLRGAMSVKQHKQYYKI